MYGNNDYRIGSIYSGINKESQSKFECVTIESVTQCKSCEIKSVCGGECYVNAYLKNSDFYNQIDKMCKIKLELNKLSMSFVNKIKNKSSVVYSKLIDFAFEINSYEKQILVVKTKISELDKTINNREMPNLVERNNVIVDKRKELATFQAEFSDITTEINHIQKIKQEVEQLLREQKENYKLMAEWKQLSDVMTGKSATKLSLERYVLQMYLQRVLNVANGRLKELTQGRYSFQIKDEKGSYSSNTGLEINIYDDNAGKVRPVQTLSGGESFIAALALALALGEVIQANAGGIFVDALFVDEGFGSLDSDALQIALEALQTIEGKNRMIGIISHVKELQEQIPFQVKISSNYGKSKISYRKDF